MGGEFGLGRSVRTSQWPVLMATFLSVLFFFGSLFLYVYVLTAEPEAVGIGVVLIMVVLFSSLLWSSFTDNVSSAKCGAALGTLASISLAAVFIPSTGNVYQNSLALAGITALATILAVRFVGWPRNGLQIGGLSIAVVMVLPIILAFAESLFLGLRFWERFFGTSPVFLFIPFIALYGFLEEALFRGIVQRSFSPVVGAPGAIILAALLNSGLMLFWGSLMFAIFTFFMGILLGALYSWSRSVFFVGTVHALQDTWLVLALILLGITL